MRLVATTRIMRTTIDIDTPMLDELRALGQREGKSLGRLVSDLLAAALATRRCRADQRGEPALEWVARPMGARVDLADREAILDAMEEERL
jgi:hypothetical protein